MPTCKYELIITNINNNIGIKFCCNLKALYLVEIFHYKQKVRRKKATLTFFMRVYVYVIY